MFKARNKKAIKDFSEKYTVSEILLHIILSGEQIMTRTVQKESNMNTMTLTGKISITEISYHPLK